MTNHWIDLKNSDVLLIMGSNAAENHPISFKWVTRAQQRGATLIHVDPRFTRTSAKADLYAPIRSGTDIVFFGGLIRHILENELYFRQYVVDYTNASYLVGPDYGFKDGLFSGFNPAAASYDRKTWAFVTDDKGVSLKDPTLKDPRCVLQVMRRHYARYDLKTVVDVTGMPEDKVLAVWNAFASTGRPDRAGTILYAMGQCQHTVGVQNIRALSMIQMLLGNIGLGRLRRLREGGHPGHQRPAKRQLVVQPRQVRGVAAESHVPGGGPPHRLHLAAQDRRHQGGGILLAVAVRAHVQRRLQGRVRVGAEPLRGRGQRGQEPQGHGQGRAPASTPRM